MVLTLHTLRFPKKDLSGSHYLSLYLRLNNMSAFTDKINSDKPTLVDFHAVWCGPCKMQEPILKSVHHKLGDKVTFLKVDIDKNPTASSAYEIKGVPTLLLFKNGEIKWRHSGVVSEQILIQAINQQLQHA